MGVFWLTRVELHPACKGTKHSELVGGYTCSKRFTCYGCVDAVAPATVAIGWSCGSCVIFGCVGAMVKLDMWMG